MYLFYKLEIESKALKFCEYFETELAYRLGREVEGKGGGDVFMYQNRHVLKLVEFILFPVKYYFVGVPHFYDKSFDIL
jgi:hypothetical protein